MFGYIIGRFNTSHVTLYQGTDTYVFHVDQSFNTSHVTLYQWTHQNYLCRHYVSIHLMLLFIVCFAPLAIPSRYVSIHLMLLFIYVFTKKDIDRFCFNTSHVTLYLHRNVIKSSFSILFQYISCYSLSEEAVEQWNRRVRFQYISCYSLSVYDKEE